MKKWSHYLYSSARLLSEWILPSTCVFCHQTSHFMQTLCLACFESLPILTHYCPLCANFLTYHSVDIACGTCQQKPPLHDKLYTLFAFDGPIKKLIRQLKFQRNLRLARFLGELLLFHITEKWYLNQKLPDLLYPVPLHRERLIKRGFNQALEITRPIAKRLHLPFERILLQQKTKVEQSQLQARARKTNLASTAKPSSHYAGLTIALIDDVITTGETIAAYSRLLKANGAKAIHVWSCARRIL